MRSTAKNACWQDTHALLFEFNITLVLDKRCKPRHISLMLCQPGIELSMSIPINGHSLDLTVNGALVGIKESSESGMSDTAHDVEFSSPCGVLTDIH